MCQVFLAAVCDHRHCVNTRTQEQVEKHLSLMARCQLDAGWHQNLTTTNHEALQASGRQVSEGRVLHHPDLHDATERKAPRSLEEFAALVLQHQLVCPKRSNRHEMALAEVDSPRYGARASLSHSKPSC